MKKLLLLLFLTFSTTMYSQEDGADCVSCCDGIDNDGDGFIDWEDFDCNQSGNPSDDCPWCSTESSCDNGVDDDGDGFIDDLDSDCSVSTCGAPIWEEDFESHSNGTMNTGRWTTSYNDCDDADINSGNNYWGVFNGEFRVNDIEGQTCCGGGGENDNYFLTEKINVSTYGALSISISVRVNGDVECSTTCNAGDILEAQYEIDGGGWNTFYTMCGATSGTVELNCEPITIGDELQIRIMVGNQANAETYYFDDIKVCSDNCGVVPLTLSPLDTFKILKPIVEEVSKSIIVIFTVDGKEVTNMTTKGTYIVTWDDYTRTKVVVY